MNRQDLAIFLRVRRARLQPADVGLPSVARRRTPGLRRQEVAQLAGISVDYYIRLEQARGPHPSRQVLAALARALVLSADEREYLFRMAGQSPPPAARPTREVSPGLRGLLDGMPANPAYIVDARYDILAWNDLATFFIGDLSGHPDTDRNMIRWMFRQPGAVPPAKRVPWSDPQAESFARAAVAGLRASYGRYPADAGLRDLITELLGLSPEFARMWESQDVASRGPLRKHVDHPLAGPLDFECQILHVGDTGQQLIVYCAEPGSPTQVGFGLLAERAHELADR